MADDPIISLAEEGAVRRPIAVSPAVLDIAAVVRSQAPRPSRFVQAGDVPRLLRVAEGVIRRIDNLERD